MRDEKIHKTKYMHCQFCENADPKRQGLYGKKENKIYEKHKEWKTRKWVRVNTIKEK